ncbi:MAG: hypothetical protein HGB17_14870, partial [Syntrophobacteraceae bacterium]|nr:hypothetical protein [Syntrophobacteraceae bacterium]
MKERRGRIVVVFMLMGVGFALVGLRLVHLQIFERGDLTRRAERQQERLMKLESKRGNIFDRTGRELAVSLDVESVFGMPNEVENPRSVARELARILRENPADLERRLASARRFVWISRKVDPAKADRVRDLDRSAIGLQVESRRFYPKKTLAGTVLGFTNVDNKGIEGVELAYDKWLRGVDGWVLAEKDAKGRTVFPGGHGFQYQLPRPGKDVILTLDEVIQHIAEKELDKGLAESKARGGVCLVMNPQTGEILAMVQYPTYENNRMARFIPAYYYNQLEQDPAHPLLNLSVATDYPPGSTFKLSTAVGVLNEGIVTPEMIVQAPGIITINESYSPTDPGNPVQYFDFVAQIDPTASLGPLRFLQCIALSSNICFYKVGGGFEEEIPEGLGIARLQEYARALGYDQASGIELPGELDGLIPDEAWKRIYKGENWSTGDTYLASVGQGYVVATPLQVLMSAATLANDGRLMQPTVVYQIQDDLGNVVQPFSPRLRWDITKDPIIRDFQCEDGYCSFSGMMKTVEPWVVDAVQSGMRQAVTDSRGTLNHEFSFKNYPIAVAGKTGTA